MNKTRLSWPCQLIAAATVALLAASAATAATVDRYWEVSPYKVQVLVDYRLSHTWNQQLKLTLPSFLGTRTKITMGPLWQLSVTPLADESGTLADEPLASLTEEQLRLIRRDFDKLIVVRLSESVTGYTVSAQQYDCLLQSWGTVSHRTTRTSVGLDELAFESIQHAFCPMAIFKVNREDISQVSLSLRGSRLPRQPYNAPLVREGDIFRPTLRRVDRTGQPVENGIQTVPWTYLRTNALSDEPITGTIVSHTRMPMGVRQRGRVDQVGMLVRPGTQTTRLRLHAREKEDEPLAGFRIYQRDAGAEGGDFVGKTEDDGTIAIKPGNTPIQVAYVQSSGKWIAKIPLVPGADGTISAPLVDDMARQEAEAKLVGIRETLIDYVARRNILASRARMKIEAGDVEGAQALISELEDKIPPATTFDNRLLVPQERLIRSNDPRVQQRITTLFSRTRDVLAEFLSPGLAQELKQELAEATSSGP